MAYIGSNNLDDFFLDGDKKLKGKKMSCNDSNEGGANRYSVQPYKSSAYSHKGVWDLTNLYQFAPYESGYCLLAVLSSPHCMRYNSKGNTKNDIYNALLQQAFVKMLENEFKGLDGIEDITTETMEFTDGISTTSRISKVNQPLQQNISMRYTEKVGTLISKYLSTYLKMIKDPRTQAKTYATLDKPKDAVYGGFSHEVFNMLYIVTDSTYLRVEKAFLLLNAFPTSAPYSDEFNMERGSIESKEITINFTANVVDGAHANKIAKAYIRTLVNLAENHEKTKINLNSSDFDYSFHDQQSNRKKISTLRVKNFTGEKTKDGVPIKINKQISVEPPQ